MLWRKPAKLFYRKTDEFQFFFTKTFLLNLMKGESGVFLAEVDDYDAIFAALKHPVRRRILLLLDAKGEVSFTDIQKAVDVEDTGLMSYHLKELALLVDQSTRGKYRLSEIGTTSIALLKKVEKTRDVSGVVRKELSRFAEKIIYFLVIVTIPCIVALSADVYASVQLVHSVDGLIVGMYTSSLLAMYFSAALFTIYNRRYFSKGLRKNIYHSMLFAVAVVLLLIPSEYVSYQFIVGTIPLQHSSTEAFYGLMLARSVLFVIGSPFVTYLTCKLAERLFERKI
jgi:DNA-binding transcriptional ArsR family regulator